MRVGIIALLHESNTFIRQPTTINHFRENMLLVGEPIREQLADSHHEVGGMLGELNASAVDAIPIFAARAIPFGPITATAFDELIDMMFTQLDRSSSLDGILVAPHGATVSERHLDADGYWLSRLRARVGPKMPLIGTLDPHGNLSHEMVRATDALVAYRTNPHLDQRARGAEAARLMVRTLRGEVRPKQAASFPPMAINIERQNTSEPHCRRLYDRADELLKTPGVLSNSIMLGFPYADVPEMGSSIIVVADNDASLAQQQADLLGKRMWEMRRDFAGNLIEVDEAVRRSRHESPPVCLLDMGDNVGGGSPADGTFLIHELRRQNVGPALVCLYDPDAVAVAHRAGVGSAVRLSVGGKTDNFHGEPFEDSFRVVRFHDGKFTEPQPRHGGFTDFDQGQCAVLCTDDGITLLVNSLRTPPFSLGQLTSCGIKPIDYRVIVAKGVNAPVAAYAPVCPTMLRVNTPGSTCADMTRLAFHRRRRPMFPFENFE